MKSLKKTVGLPLVAMLTFLWITGSLACVGLSGGEKAFAFEIPPNPIDQFIPDPSEIPGPGTRDEVQLTPPVGSDYLPNAPLPKNIKISYVFSNLIPFLIRFGISLAGILCVLALIFGGYMYLTAYGSSEKHTKALNVILYALIGLIITITAYGIVQIIVRINLT